MGPQMTCITAHIVSLLQSTKRAQHRVWRAGVFLLLLLLPLLSVAERYEGYVLDEAGQPVPFATVYLQDNPYTDS